MVTDTDHSPRTPDRLTRLVTKGLDAERERRDNGHMSDGPRQCPYCDLRFEYHNEVKDHILHDHPGHEDVVALIEPHEMPH